MKTYLAYAALGLAILAAGFGIGKLTAETKTVTKTRVVTKTKVVMKRQVFNGTLGALTRYLHPQAGQEAECPKNYKPGVSCYILVGDSWLVNVAFAPSETAR